MSEAGEVRGLRLVLCELSCTCPNDAQIRLNPMFVINRDTLQSLFALNRVASFCVYY